MGNIIRKSNNNPNKEESLSEFDNLCPICLIKFKEKNLIVLNCGHKYHASCIFQTLAINHNKCPLCRKKMKYIYPNKHHLNTLLKERNQLSLKLFEINMSLKQMENNNEEEESEEDDIYDEDIF